MKTIHVKRWIALSAIDHLSVSVPDDYELDVDVEQHRILHETREIIDSTDRGPWELEDQ